MLNFGAVTPGVHHKHQDFTAIQDSVVTARIDGGDGMFRLAGLICWHYEPETPSYNPPPPGEEDGLPPDTGTPLVPVQLGSSDGVTPLNVPAEHFLQVNVTFHAEDDGAFNLHAATVSIFGLGTEPLVVPISGAVGEVRAEITNPHIVIAQAGETLVPISIRSVFGAGTEVQLTVRGQNNVAMAPVTLIVPRGGMVQANLRFTAHRQSHVLTQPFALDMYAFGGEHQFTYPLTVQIVPAAPPGGEDDFRCGVSRGTSSLDPLTWGATIGRWSRGALRVSINTDGCNLDPNGISITAEEIIQEAFRRWERAAPFFDFDFVPPSQPADIRVRFGDQTLYHEFGTPGGTIAGALPPEHGVIWFDSAEQWINGWRRRRPNLMATAVHEVGHALGLDHSSGVSTTMAPSRGHDDVDEESRRLINLLYGWAPQQQLPDRATSDRPALAVTHFGNFTDSRTTPRMVWKGSREDTALYESEFIAGRWTPQRRIPGIVSGQSPALASLPIPGGAPQTGLIMAWKAPGSNQGIWWSRDLGHGWEAPLNIREIGSSTRPALVNADGRIVMAWKGIRDTTEIYFSFYDGIAGWSPQRRVEGVGTSDSPALAAVGRKVFMFWKGIPGDNTAYFSVMDLNDPNPTWRPSRRITYRNWDAHEDLQLAIGTSGPLTACRRGDDVLLAWKGSREDTAIYFTLLIGEVFQGPIQVHGVGTSVGPAVASVPGGTLMAWKGIPGDNTLWFSTLGLDRA